MQNNIRLLRNYLGQSPFNGAVALDRLVLSIICYRTKYFPTRSKMCCGDVFVSMCFTDDVGADIVSEPCYCVFLHLR